jgi:hypothetical protein
VKPENVDSVAIVYAEVSTDIAGRFKKKSGYFEPAALAPAGIVLVAPGEKVEFGDRVYRAPAKEWAWVAFDNSGTKIKDGKEKEPSKAIEEASMSLTMWASPAIAVAHENLLRAGKTSASIEKAMRGFTARAFSADGKKLPAAGKSSMKKGPTRMKAKISGEKAKKGMHSADGVVWYIEMYDDDGKKMGKKLGPFVDGIALSSALSGMFGLLQGEQDAIEANPIQRNRLKSTARRKLARKNGVKEWFTGEDFNVESGPVDLDDKNPFKGMMGLPASSAEAHQMGYYRGIIRGLKACKWYPSPTGIYKRWQFERDMRKKLFDTMNSLAQQIEEKPHSVRTVR